MKVKFDKVLIVYGNAHDEEKVMHGMGYGNT